MGHGTRMTLLPHDVMPFTARGRADGQSNHNERTAPAVPCSDGLSLHDGYERSNPPATNDNASQARTERTTTTPMTTKTTATISGHVVGRG